METIRKKLEELERLEFQLNVDWASTRKSRKTYDSEVCEARTKHDVELGEVRAAEDRLWRKRFMDRDKHEDELRRRKRNLERRVSGADSFLEKDGKENSTNVMELDRQLSSTNQAIHGKESSQVIVDPIGAMNGLPTPSTSSSMIQESEEVLLDTENETLRSKTAGTLTCIFKKQPANGECISSAIPLSDNPSICGSQIPDNTKDNTFSLSTPDKALDPEASGNTLHSSRSLHGSSKRVRRRSSSVSERCNLRESSKRGQRHSSSSSEDIGLMAQYKAAQTSPRKLRSYCTRSRLLNREAEKESPRRNLSRETSTAPKHLRTPGASQVIEYIKEANGYVEEVYMGELRGTRKAVYASLDECDCVVFRFKAADKYGTAIEDHSPRRTDGCRFDAIDFRPGFELLSQKEVTTYVSARIGTKEP